LIAGLLGIIAAVSGSLAVTAELVHNAVDLVSAGGVLIGLKIAARKSKAFPCGLYKVENIVAAAVGVMIFLTAYEIAHSIFFGAVPQPRVDLWMLPAMAVTLAIPLIFSHLELRAARAVNSPALIAQAREYRIHTYTAGLALAALLSAWFRLPLDRFAALVIVAAVVKTGWELFADAIRVLLDASLDADSLNEVRRIILMDPAVTEVKWITGRNAGRFRFVEAGVALRVSELGMAEAAMQRIERSVRAGVPQIERALLHVEAGTASRTCYAVPLASLAGRISDHFGEAPYFAFVSVDCASGSVAEQRVLRNPHRLLEKGKGIQVAQWLAGQKADIVLVRVDLAGRGPSYVLRDAGIEVRRTGKRTLEEAFALLGGLNQAQPQSG
jgi:cation diffusion facilitator family transporter